MAAARPPVWLMRQAGRYLPEYRAVRARAGSFLRLCLEPELAVEATVQPLRRFGMDAAILFSDILLVPHGLGQSVDYVDGDGPRLATIRSAAEVARLRPEHLTERLAPVYETVRRLVPMLDDQTALIGFAGAPWTVASYMVEGGGSKDFAAVKAWAYGDPAGFALLVDQLVAATIEHLSAQITAGVEVVQLFDSWAGVLAPTPFRAWVIEPTRRVVAALKERHPAVPIIGFPRGVGLMLPAYVEETGVDAVSLDASVPPQWAAREIQQHRPVQGNLDPLFLLAGGQALEHATRAILEVLAPRPFVFNLGHGVHPATPPQHVAALAALVRGWPDRGG